MNQHMQAALFQMYSNQQQAASKQAARGGHDQGERSKVTGGKHLEPVAAALRQDLIDRGFPAEGVYYRDGCLKLPGWFRPSKAWDLLAFAGPELLAAVELKSISSSFGNNANNRSEIAGIILLPLRTEMLASLDLIPILMSSKPSAAEVLASTDGMLFSPSPSYHPPFLPLQRSQDYPFPSASSTTNRNKT